MPDPRTPSEYAGARTYGETAGTVEMSAAPRRISWGAIFAGALVAIVAQLLLSLLGLGIGLSTINPTSEADPVSGLGVGAAIWWVISSLISLFLGGWVAGRLAGIPRAADSTLHGVLTWGLVTMLTFYLLTTAVGRLISGATSVVGQGLALAGQGVAAVGPQAADAVKNKLNEQGINLASIRQEAETLLRQTGKPELQPESLQAQAQQAGQQAQTGAQTAAENPQQADDTLLKNLFREGRDTVDAADRDAAVNVVVERTGKPRAEAEQIVDRWIASYQSAREKLKQTGQQVEETARDVGEKAASGLSKAALMAFFGLLLSAGAAAFGGNLATPRPLEVGIATIPGVR
ncbi:MAG: hypothetical protein M3463_14225 [Verrucomicrobiota bacterium]|nr:hypothetical protein [Verrucomicrobiota bacterium]